MAHDPDVLSSHTKENRREHKARDQFWVESDGEMEETLLNPRNAHQVTVTLQDAKATLARANSRHEPGRASIWRTTDVTGNLKSHIGLDSDLSPARLPLTNQEEDAENLAAAKVQLLNSDSILTESQKTAVVRLKDAPQHSQSFQLAPPSLLTARLNEALKGRHPPDPLPTSQRLPPPSSPLLYPPAARSLCGRVEELQLKVWNQVAVAAEKQTIGQSVIPDTNIYKQACLCDFQEVVVQHLSLMNCRSCDSEEAGSGETPRTARVAGQQDPQSAKRRHRNGAKRSEFVQIHFNVHLGSVNELGTPKTIMFTNSSFCIFHRHKLKKLTKICIQLVKMDKK